MLIYVFRKYNRLNINRAYHIFITSKSNRQPTHDKDHTISTSFSPTQNRLLENV